jgi:N-acetylmuramoyl-L-alanine amidase
MVWAGLCSLGLVLPWPAQAQTRPSPPPNGANQAQASPKPTKPLVATDGEMSVASGQTELKLVLAASLSYQIDMMTRPDRIIIDLPEVNFQLAPDFGRKPQGLIKSARFGLFAPGRSRIVVELTAPARPTVALKETLGGAAYHFILTLEPTSQENFQKLAQERPTHSNMDQRLSEGGANGPPLIGATPQDAADQRPLIVLDPGHGGIDLGAIGVGQAQEKNVVLDFARELKAKLDATGHYRVVLTRDRDVFVSLGDRVRLAQKLGAALFISIHADTLAAAPDVSGFTVYTGSEKASDADAARLAEAENLSDQIAGVENEEETDEIAGILGDLTLRETRSYSHLFARTLVGQMSGAGTKANKNPHRSARFRVLRAPDVPSVLLELGYLSSKTDTEMMKNPVWRDQTTATITQAINEFMAPRLAKGQNPTKPHNQPKP